MKLRDLAAGTGDAPRRALAPRLARRPTAQLQVLPDYLLTGAQKAAAALALEAERTDDARRELQRTGRRQPAVEWFSTSAAAGTRRSCGAGSPSSRPSACS